MTIADYIRSSAKRLSDSNIQCQDPSLHMRQILCHVLRMESSQLIIHWNEELIESQLKAAETILTRRLKGEPFQYLVGYEWFWDSPFEVGEGVLIPRKETEVLVETLLREVNDGEKFAELGGGSGNIGISALLERPSLIWYAYESNPSSVSYLDRNRARLLPEQAQFHAIAGDFFTRAQLAAPYDWIVSNPPYVAASEWSDLPREVKEEPRAALIAGSKGTEIIEKLIQSSQTLLSQRGSILLEIGMGQSRAVVSLLSDYGFDSHIINDYSGIERVVLGRRRQ